MIEKFCKQNILLIFSAVFLSGCSSLLPGMQNANLSSMRVVPSERVVFRPILIPITASLVENTCYSGYTYHIAPADVLDITVWRHPEFSFSESNRSTAVLNVPSTQGAAGQEGYLVDEKGFIYFPAVGQVYVAGQTVNEVRTLISSRLRRYVKKPIIKVRVVDFRGKKIYVFGEVNKPGFIPLNDQNLTIIDAITLTGGLDPNAADTEHIFVIRRTEKIYEPNIFWLNAKTPEGLLLAELFNLKPNDILYVSSAPATRWNRVLNQLLPTIQTIWYTKSIINSRN